MEEVSVMSVLLILLTMFFAALTVWAGLRLHRLLSRRAHAADLQRRVYMLPHWRLAGRDRLYRMTGL